MCEVWVVCCGPVLGTCAECKRTKSKCNKSRGKAKAVSDEKVKVALDENGKAPGKFSYSSPAFLGSSACATQVCTACRQTDPLPFELSDSDNMEMELPIAQGKRKAKLPTMRRATRSPVDLPHATGFRQIRANMHILQGRVSAMDAQLDELWQELLDMEKSLE
jgi:hypothetical protein